MSKIIYRRDEFKCLGFAALFILASFSGVQARAAVGGMPSTFSNYMVLQYPNYETDGKRSIANFYLSLLHAVGDKREKFGEPDLQLRDINTSGPLAEILA
jgi:hypothetical protein